MSSKNNISSGFSRVFGTKGYDYGWNTEYSHLDGGIIVVAGIIVVVGII